ncbi:hypothetical protein NQ358_24615, partial [Escherichia coli]|nr:hypothetical protein [Escherichia coli]
FTINLFVSDTGKPADAEHVESLSGITNSSATPFETDDFETCSDDQLGRIYKNIRTYYLEENYQERVSDVLDMIAEVVTPRR